MHAGSVRRRQFDEVRGEGLHPGALIKKRKSVERRRRRAMGVYKAERDARTWVSSAQKLHSKKLDFDCSQATSGYKCPASTQAASVGIYLGSGGLDTRTAELGMDHQEVSPASDLAEIGLD
ncbi:hypothetical protein PMIN06_002915 [Paraphaeosphaeria minitans]|uniref:Uncharacterized protein n=1 Tax=Paraphaeosphaeria minitans TaxID=565426 RepID=A0A9P6GMD4_9PLEO|nr:hypothetical protein PMIN01_03346 [Paraphaeosphaeria minitans]